MTLHNPCNWRTIRLGVLALQGDFHEHLQMLRRLAAEMEGALALELREVRLPQELTDLDGLIIPGGESTTFSKLAEGYGLIAPLRNFAATRPTWGTCAGMIFLAKELDNAAALADEPQRVLGRMDLTVERNAFGRQVDSFVADLPIVGLRGGPFHAIFIRAPIVSQAGAEVQVLARTADGRIVAARQGHLLATSFHPELGEDLRLHRLFLNMVAESLA
ncbi:MAG: pyridoxal 5'-phosphate synthase glutaminase subunit PdxT [Anaerolineaceae bacterium]|nr:pyridoxal 5'-phosphate synthase glutaminase subunit PdxT [Anaerolineaceae bacterium]